MRAFALQYTYLVSSLALLVIFLLLYTLNPKQRRPMLLSGLFSAPFAFGSLFFVPEYWNPVRIASFGAGPEDILFSFSTGGIAWICSLLAVRQTIHISTAAHCLKRYAAICLCGLLLYWILSLFTTFGVMTNTLISIIVHGLLLSMLQHRLWLIPLSGGITFGAGYTLFAALVFLLNPSFIQQWNLDSLTGILVLGFPVEELFWAVAFGTVWPLFMAYVFDAGFKMQIENASPHENHAYSN